MNSLLHTELIEKIEKALDPIRPYLARDGGNVRVVNIKNDAEGNGMTVEVQLLGSCANCDVSMLTMKAGVEETIKRAFPEIKSVQAVSVK